MKVVLLHGPGIIRSRQKLLEIKENFKGEIVTYYGALDVTANLITVPLFQEPRMIIWENPSDELSLEGLDLSLVLWFDKELSEKSSILKYTKSAGQVLFYPESKESTVFTLLDLLGNQDIKAFLEIERLKKEGVQLPYLVTMALYLLRSLLVTPKNAPPFVKNKLNKQSSNFSADRLVELYKKVLDTDFKFKNGLLEGPQAEFNLINLFMK